MSDKNAFPLDWPDGRPRTISANRKTNGNFRASFATARDNCIAEVKRLQGDRIIVSTNIPLKADGTPRAVEWGKSVPDPGVAVYFTRKGKQLCFACDRWIHVQDNMHAIGLTIEALRGIARWGTGDMMEAAFRGFAALPAPGESSGVSWWQVLGVAMNATGEQVREAYRDLVKKHHPDVGGDREKFEQVQKAWEEFRIKYAC
jgi:hypothetical protein